MYEEVSETDVLKVYLFNQNRRGGETALKKKSGVDFGPNGFFFGKKEYTDMELRKIRTGCGAAESRNLKTVEDLKNAGLLGDAPIRTYFALLRSGMSVDDAGRRICGSGGKLKSHIMGTSTPKKGWQKAAADALNVSPEFLVGGDISCFEITEGRLGASSAGTDADALPLIPEGEVSESLPGRIRLLMNRKGMDARDLSTESGIQVANIRKYMERTTAIGPKNAVRLAKALGTTPGYVRYGSDSEREDIFWYRFAELMDEAGAGTREAASMTGIELSRLDRLLAGSTLPTKEEAEAIARAFDADPASIPMAQLKPDGRIITPDMRRTHAEERKETRLGMIAKEHGMTQSDIAKMIGAEPEAVSRLARGMRRESETKYMPMIAKILGMKTEELFPDAGGTVRDADEEVRKTGSGAKAENKCMPYDGTKSGMTEPEALGRIWNDEPSEWGVIEEALKSVLSMRKDMAGTVAEVIASAHGWPDRDVERMIGALEEMKRLRGLA